MPWTLETDLDGSHVGVLRSVLVQVEAIFCQLNLLEVHTQLHKKNHHRLQGGDGTVPGSLGRDMFVEDRESSLRLPYCDEFLCSLWRAKISAYYSEHSMRSGSP